MIAELLSADMQAPSADIPALAVADPLVEMDAPVLPVGAIPEPRFEAPKIDPDQWMNIAPFASRAQLAQGEVVTVILLLQIAADGSVISALVVRSNGNEAANEAAIEYAKATQWISGEIDGEPRAMQASLTVILGETV
jgi:TonB family protein